MSRLIECVPNFSEGRDDAVVSALVEAVASVPSVLVLHRTSDVDHHRSVLTFAGPPDAVGEAAFRAVHAASQRIDMRRHQGGHPCVGATDVVPFVPLRGSTMADCVTIAHQVGERIGRELRIPVFFYEEAAPQVFRRRLETIRQGGLPALAQRMGTHPGWKPDCGPTEPHPSAGVTVVGARPFLVAFNVNLDSRDMSLAKAIAKSVRASNGGLPAVKAIGVDLPSRGQVQVSMNLVDLAVTPVHVAFKAVQTAADRAGVRIAESELIGLVPQQAVVAAASAGLCLERLAEDNIVEMRLEQIRAASGRLMDQSLGDLLDAIGSERATPAGAAVAALAGALVAQLGGKLSRLPSKRAQLAGLGRESEARPVLERRARELCRLAEADVVAYERVLVASRLASDNPDRQARLQEALVAATEVPLAMAEQILEVTTVLERLAPEPARSVRVDWDVARLVGNSCMCGLLRIVDSNINRMTNHSVKSMLRLRSEKIESYLEGFKGLC